MRMLRRSFAYNFVKLNLSIYLVQSSVSEAFHALPVVIKHKEFSKLQKQLQGTLLLENWRGPILKNYLFREKWENPDFAIFKDFLPFLKNVTKDFSDCCIETEFSTTDHLAKTACL